jgi:hypothetical protein
MLNRVTRDEPTVLVTTAARNPADERRERERRYLLTMGLRVLCFVAAIVLFAVGPRWAGFLAALASLVLPWVAVVVANAGPRRRRSDERPALYAADRPRELPPKD